MARRVVAGRGELLEALALRGDDPAGDGVRATRVIPTAHLVPGLVKIDGYTALCRMVTSTFAVAEGDPEGSAPANFVPFPYDWRRDLRVIAGQLDRFVRRALPTWREYSGARDAKVIVLAHSMGGLIARYWATVLGGHEHCRALVTLGTPHRGSLAALDYLVNGYRKLFVDLTEVMRTFPSVHHLLPIYPCVSDGTAWHRPAELAGLPGVDPRLAADALAFHREIEAAQVGDYGLIPVVGTAQRTAQSAVVTEAGLSIGHLPPEGVDLDFADGDGTVPRVSAIPIELSGTAQMGFVPERHSSLQNSPVVLSDLRDKLLMLQARGLSALRGPEGEPFPQPPGIELEVPDACLAGEPIEIRARRLGASGPLTAVLDPVYEPGPPVRIALAEDGDAWTGVITGVAPGVHRLTVSDVKRGPDAPHPVHDLVEVVAP
ncbi:esterase/lipase family protein [Actinokineospora baliensis]|uniref:esterase/lipase family protein n=1 Tax=Actinokineospora baliensis TaxID=547056 RepID=UPI001958C1ED|nr:alpha/beta fold hydrolase [Actinokineospora baliensis]